GIESRDARGRRRTFGRRRLPETLAAELRELCAHVPGAWVEDKGSGLSVHYRAVPPRRRPAFAAALRRRVGRHRHEVEFTHGLRVYELRPAGSPDKAAALQRWLGPTRNGRVLVYLGDDANDRPALSWTRARGGFAIAVGNGRLAASHHLESPAAAVR